jgi:hypothetical protein
MSDEKPTDHKMHSFILPQWGLFVTTQFDAHDVGLSLAKVDGWLDWRLNWFGWQVGVWLERTDK